MHPVAAEAAPTGPDRCCRRAFRPDRLNLAEKILLEVLPAHRDIAIIATYLDL